VTGLKNQQVKKYPKIMGDNAENGQMASNLKEQKVKK